MEKNEKGYSEYNFTGRGSTSGGCRNSSGGSGCGCGNGCAGGSGGGASGGNAAGGGCMPDADFGGAQRQLAMVYSPYQCWHKLYTPDEALKHGTLFEELYKPLGECGNGR